MRRLRVYPSALCGGNSLLVLTILLSFGFYIPVVLWAEIVPMVGMLMIPKTCAYVWVVLIGYWAMKEEARKIE